jgi:hypothetical protein
MLLDILKSTDFSEGSFASLACTHKNGINMNMSLDHERDDTGRRKPTCSANNPTYCYNARETFHTDAPRFKPETLLSPYRPTN